MKPEQRKSTSEKLSDKDWQKKTANFYRSIAIPFLDVAEGNLLYKAAVGNHKTGCDVPPPAMKPPDCVIVTSIQSIGNSLLINSALILDLAFCCCFCDGT